MSSKIFGTLTLIALAVACFIGLKNKAAYQNEITVRQETESKLKTTKARLDKAIKDRDETRAANDAMEAEIPKVQAQKDEQDKSNKELADTKVAKTTEAEGNKAKLDAAREKTQALGNIKDLASKMGSMIVQLKGLEDSVRESEAKLASLTNENSGIEARVAKQREDSEKRSKGESLPELRTHISAIYPSWGFVTLAAGNTAGVIANSTLDVVRDDEVIAKLLVTAVERNTASASIIPDTVKADVTLMAGDQVVPGVKVSTPAPAASPNPVPTN
jgi:hypothetical protein